MNQFTPPQPLNTAVLFLVFNRLDTTKQVFAAIKEAKPPRLYIAADGARESKIDDIEKVTAVRDFITANIDWKCEVRTLFREQNLACKTAISAAIDWFFETEEMGIILEDDCLPSQSFFWFCEELLEKYNNDMRIWHIGGNNFGSTSKKSRSDYVFIRYPQVWGWATWKTRWVSYDKDLTHFDQSQYALLSMKDTLGLTYNEALSLKERNLQSAAGLIDAWDYQWQAIVNLNHGICVVPTINLISNLGDGADATHTVGDSERTHLPIGDISSPFRHPKSFFIDYTMERLFKRKMKITQSLYNLIKMKLYRYLK